MTQHTKGEWKIHDYGYHNLLGITANGRKICKLYEEEDKYGDKEFTDFDNYQANARLIAAAPKLLGLAEEHADIELQMHRESLGETFMIGSKQRLEQWVEDRNAAIAAAKPEAQA